jgi:hypothetical protein
MKIINIDIFDIWSMPILIWKTKNGDLVQYFYLAWGWEIAKYILSLRNIKIKPIKSIFDEPETETYRRYHSEGLLFMHQLESSWKSYFNILPIYQKLQSKRTIRCVTQHYANINLPFIELVQSFIRFEKKSTILIMRRTWLTSEYKKYCESKNWQLINYVGNCSINIKYGNNGLSAENFYCKKREYFKIVIKPTIQIVLSIVSIFINIHSKIVKSKTIKTYDAMVYLCQPTPNLGFNEIFWANVYSQKYKRSIIAIADPNLGENGKKFHKKKIEKIIKDEYIILLKYFSISLLMIKNLKINIEYINKSQKLPLNIKIYLIYLEIWSAKYQTVMLAHKVKVFFSICQGSSTYQTGGLILATQRSDIPNIGSTWSSPDCPGIHLARSYTEHFLHWGEWQLENFEKSDAIFENSVNIGYPEWEILKEKAKEAITKKNPELMQGKKIRIITFFDNAYGHSFYLSIGNYIQLYNAILKKCMCNEDIFLIIKTKRKTLLSKLPLELYKLIDNLKNENRLLLEEGKADISLGMMDNIVIGVGPATPALIAGNYSKSHVIVFDKYDLIKSSVSLKDKKKVSFASSIEEFSQMLDKALFNYETKNSEGLEPLYSSSTVSASELVASYLVGLERFYINSNVVYNSEINKTEDQQGAK